MADKQHKAVIEVTEEMQMLAEAAGVSPERFFERFMAALTYADDSEITQADAAGLILPLMAGRGCYTNFVAIRQALRSYKEMCSKEGMSEYQFEFTRPDLLKNIKQNYLSHENQPAQQP